MAPSRRVPGNGGALIVMGRRGQWGARLGCIEQVDTNPLSSLAGGAATLASATVEGAKNTCIPGDDCFADKNVCSSFFEVPNSALGAK